MTQKYDHLLHSPTVLRVHLAALTTQEQEVVTHEMRPAHHLVQVELVLDHPTQAVEVEGLVRVVVRSAQQGLEGGAYGQRLAVWQVVADSRAHLLVLGLELRTAGHVGHGAEVDESAAVVSVDHDIDLLQIPVDEPLLSKEKKSHADILYHLHLAWFR